MPWIATVRGMKFREITGDDGLCKGYELCLWDTDAARLGVIAVGPLVPKMQFSDTFEKWLALTGLGITMRAYRTHGMRRVALRFPDNLAAFAFRMVWL